MIPNLTNASSLVVVPIVLAGGALLWLRRRTLVVTVTGHSMEPEFRHGGRVLIRRAPVTTIRPGNVVVIEQDPAEAGPDDPKQGPHLMIKRVVAVPGDPVPRDAFPALRETPTHAVPPGHLVVAGDNPKESYDSRHYGYVPADRFIGVVVRRINLTRPQ